ncbi:MAG: chemotaxis protein CheW [Candidatus Omnitrophica bacterium]|nr:chemotaxis protein CheW [Candidatus Omnitrophota bacterium]
MKILVFSIGDKDYGADIAQIREVIRMRKVTRVPEAAAFVEGVISLRGRVIPLINLRKKLGMKSEEVPSNRIVVTTIQNHWTGILVDQVKTVMTLKPEDIAKPDEVLQSVAYLVGVTKWEGRLILLVDITGFLRGEESDGLRKVQERVEIIKKEIK